MTTLPVWAEHALNGSSHRVAERWQYDIGDFICGTVMFRGRDLPTRFNRDGSEFLDLKVEVGTAAKADRQFAPGEWVRVYCSPAQLREWLVRDDPREGAQVAIRYEGIDEYADGTSKHKFIAGVAPREDADADVAAGASESPW